MSSERRPRWARWALAPLVAAAALGCADFSRGPTQVSTDETPDAGGSGDGNGALSFATDGHPLLTTSQNCHVAATDYTTILKFVDTSAPEGSRMLSKMSGNGHGGGTIYAAGTPEYQTVLHWIQQGAPP